MKGDNIKGLFVVIFVVLLVLTFLLGGIVTCKSGGGTYSISGYSCMDLEKVGYCEDIKKDRYIVPITNKTEISIHV